MLLLIIFCIDILFSVTQGYSFARQAYGPQNKICEADEEEPWSYHGKTNGVKYWSRIDRNCSGRSQSPIAVKTRNVLPDKSLPKLYLNNYNIPVSKATIENNGHTVEVRPTDGVSRTIKIKGSTYNLEQFHFHWGSEKHLGSEHIIDGVQYNMELHFVHRNNKREYAVVAVFFEEEKWMNGELQKIIKTLSKVKFRNMRTELKGKLNLNYLLPENPSSYFRYIGSLTTPNCAEGVIWSLLPKPLPVATKQLEAFDQLFSATDEEAASQCKIVDNYRPIQPLNNRKIYYSV